MPDAGCTGGALAGPVVLVGLMGSGKTTAGRKVARLVGTPFVDADEALEARTGRSVAAWFAEGEAAFRRAEADVLAELLGRREAVVVGAGGGVVVTEANRALLAQPEVTTVYLHAPPAFLASRAKAKAHRPLLAGDPEAVLATMYDQRDRWYRQVADVVVEVAPAHQGGAKPKWRLARAVVDALVATGAVDPAAVATPDLDADLEAVATPDAPGQRRP